MNLDLRATRRIRVAAACAILLAAANAAAGERINKDADNLAIRGYDTVAYFTQGRPVEGKPEFAYVWQDARWQFASAEHRDLFAGEPDRYAPQFGGFCTGGVGLGRLAPVDPEAWVIVAGRLYLHHDRAGRDATAADPGPSIAAAVERWEELGRTP